MLDKSFMGKARYFAHGTTEVSSFVDGRGSLNWQKLPGLYENQRKKGRPSKQDMLKMTFRLEDKVKDANGDRHTVKDIKPDTPIFCPVCGDEPYRTNQGNHNAVLLINDEGLPFIYCSSCESRGMGVSGKGVYNLHPDDAYWLKSEEHEATAFIDTLTSTYRSFCKEPGLEEPVIRQLTTLNHVEQFNKAHDLPNPVVYPRARLELHPEKDDIINFEEGYINKYMVPQVLKRPVPEGHVARLPNYIGKIIDHVLAHE